MMKKEWLSILKESRENASSARSVQKSEVSHPPVVAPLVPPRVRRQSMQVVYEVGGVWKGEFEHAGGLYTMLALPGAGTTSEEGRPEVPQDGIFVAVPRGTADVAVRVVDKTVEDLPGVHRLRPSPKPITEGECVAGGEAFQPRADAYDSDEAYPGRDFDLLGLRRFQGITVVHVMVYPVQYRPLSGRLSLATAMTLEVSCDVPVDAAALPEAPGILEDMILMEGVGSEEERPSHGGREAVAAGSAAESAAGAAADPGADPGAAVAPGVGPGVAAVPPGPAGGAVPLGGAGAPVLKRADRASGYVIITPRRLMASVAPLCEAKAGPPHFAMVAPTEDISAEFPAADLKDSIRAFLGWALAHWQLPPRYVVLAGDVDAIPVHPWPLGNAPAASDHYYADLDGSLSPDIVVSRIPTSDPDGMLQICRNLADYPERRAAAGGTWQNRVALIAQAQNNGVYVQCLDGIASDIGMRFQCIKLYGGSSTQAEVVGAMDAGVLVANYRGHGTKTSWQSHGLGTAQIRALTNGEMPPLVFCICCQNAYIDDQATETVVEAFLRAGKCVAVLGASRPSPTYANNDLNRYLWEAILNHGESTPGGIFQRAKALLVQNHADSPLHVENVVMYMLFGDPTAQVF